MITIILAITILLLLFITTLICYFKAFYSPAKERNDFWAVPRGKQYQAVKTHLYKNIDRIMTIPFESVSIISYDGLILTARYYHTADNAPLAICFHGYKSCGVRDFSGGLHYSLSHGQNVLLVDQRAQGKSQGHSMTFGVKEKYDCKSWIDYGITRFGENTSIYLYGVSMGGATVLMAPSLGLPKNVIAIIADSPYNSAEGIIRKVCHDMKLSPRLLYPFLNISARIFAGFKISDGDVFASVRTSKIPILIFHGEDDRFVPCQMSVQLKEAFPDKIRLETFPYAGHALNYLIDTKRYECILDSFFLCKS